MEVTVLFYQESNPFKLESEQIVCEKMRTGDRAGQPVFTETFREGKLIAAVIEGHVNVLNAMGDQWETLPDDEPLDVDCPVQTLANAR